MGNGWSTPWIAMAIFSKCWGYPQQWVVLWLSYHKEQEIYIITQGDAELLTGANSSHAVTAGDTIYIPENSWHGIKNVSQSVVEFVWIFPTDTWQEVRYIFANETLNKTHDKSDEWY